MPVKIREGLPAIDVLAAENVFVMTDRRAASQDIRPLSILVLNLMPAKQTTEAQLLRLLGNSPLQVEVTFLQTDSYSPRHTDHTHLEVFYETFEGVRDRCFDGLIITGAPVELMEFEDVDYWDELVGIMDWADAHVFSTLAICWGAQAELYHHYGIGKEPVDAEGLRGVQARGHRSRRTSSPAGSTTPSWRRTPGTRPSGPRTSRPSRIWSSWRTRPRQGSTWRRRRTVAGCS